MSSSERLTRAESFLAHEARVIDRVRFAHRFGDGSAEAVVRALLAYQNGDGGFGYALEPDIRGVASHPVALEHALLILDEAARFEAGIVEAACEWLTQVSVDGGGVPFVLASVAEGPHAPWWVATGSASLNPTAGILGLLYKNTFDHPWVERATAFVWEMLPTQLDSIGGDDARCVLRFLQHSPERGRAEAVFEEQLAPRVLSELVSIDPAASGYVKTPLDFAPQPASIARQLFPDQVIEQHLDALAARQQPDGGWPISWTPPSHAAVNEWRGFVTVEALQVLANYDAL